MAIDYQKILEDLKNAVADPVKVAAKDLISSNKEAAEFLEDRAKRVAELGVEYIKAGDDATRDAIKLQLDVVRQSIQNELSSIALGASLQARETFNKVLTVALDVAMKALPVIVAAL